MYILLDILLYINCSSTTYTYHTIKYAADVLAGPAQVLRRPREGLP